jgi:hypothetical protein
MTPSQWDFPPAERVPLVWVKISLRRGHLKYSEWAIKTPSIGRRLRVGWDNRFEQPQPAAHRSEL